MAAAPKPKEALMPKLTDTQLVILSAAAQRQDRAVLPLPKSLKIKGATTKTLEGLRKRGLLEEKPATRNAVVWREGEGGRRLMLVITDSGLQAIGVIADENACKQLAATKVRAKKSRRRTLRKPTAATPKGTKSQTAARQGTKQALLIDLLKRKKGATIEAIVETLGWLPHTVRAALTRLRQQDFQIERVRQNGVSRYRIAEDRKAA
jgi:DNA-binding MarR family transcriptional regulator